MVSDRTLNKIAAVGVVSIIVGLSSGCGTTPIGAASDRYITLIQDVRSLGSTGDSFIYQHTELGQCPPYVVLDQPAECAFRDPSQTDMRSIHILDPVTLTQQRLDIEISDNNGTKADRFHVVWIDADADTLFAYDLQTGELSAHLEGAASEAGDFVLTVGGDYVAMYAGDDDTEETLTVYSLSQKKIVADLNHEGIVAAIEGDWIAYLAVNDNEEDTQYPDVVDLILLNLKTDEERIVVDDLPNGRYGPSLWIHDGALVWTYFATSAAVNAMSYDIATGSTDVIFERPNAGNAAALPTSVTDVGDPGLLLVQQSGDGSGNTRYEFVSWQGAVTTLYEFKDTERHSTWYQYDHVDFAGDRAIWTDPFVGNFMIRDLNTGETGEFYPYDR